MNARSLPLAFAAALAVMLSTQSVEAQHVYRVDNQGTVEETGQQLQGSESIPRPSARPTDEKEGYGECCEDGCPDICCEEFCRKLHWQVFGEFLYLRPRNAGVEYAVPIDSRTSVVPPTPPVQEGPTAVVNPQFDAGFRVGMGLALDDCANVSATYTRYDNRTNDAIDIANIPSTLPLALRSMVMHPTTLDAAGDWDSANAYQTFNFNLADLDYRRVFLCSEDYSINYVLGLRYANMKEQFHSEFDHSITVDVDTNVNFDGGGLRLGLEGERFGCNHRFFVYGKGAVSLLGGEFEGSYVQGAPTLTPDVQTDWREARLVTILDCELGAGWESPNGHVRLSAGYTINAWLNAVKTADFIASVQANQYHGTNQVDGSGLVFDGVVARVEFKR